METPFSIRSTFSFYASLMVRYRRPLAAMTVSMTVYAGLSALRLASVGLLVDSIRTHVQASGGIVGKDDGGEDPGLGQGMVEEFESLWGFVFGEAIPAPTHQIGSSEGFNTFLLTFVGALAALSLLLAGSFFFKEMMAIRMMP